LQGNKLLTEILTVKYKSKSQPSNLLSAALIKKISKILDGGYMGAICTPTIVKGFDDILTPV
jgi:hypothetical protein